MTSKEQGNTMGVIQVRRERTNFIRFICKLTDLVSKLPNNDLYNLMLACVWQIPDS